MAAAEIKSSSNRAYALDALRGIAILAMLLSGQIFSDHPLPAWMYHAQEPPPTFQWSDTIYGISWVDLVFPFFLFSMGAAFPLAFSRRMDEGMPTWRLGWFILERGILLAFFALYVVAIRPYTLMNHPDTKTWWIALLGFALLFPLLTRLPRDWSTPIKIGIRIFGWAGTILFMAVAKYPDGSGFSLGRSDIIIIVLTNMAVFGSIVWMLTRKHWLPRLGVMGIMLAIRLSNMPHPVEGWVKVVWDYQPVGFAWLYRLYFCQYLCIVIPGTIAGDIILQWTRTPRTDFSPSATGKRWPAWRSLAICGLMFSFVVVSLIGLKARWLVPTTLTIFAMCGLGYWLLSKPQNETELLYRKLFLWGSYWLVLGYFFEPYEGGIRKDHPTLSYYFVTAGLAHCMLIGLSIIVDGFRWRRWVPQFLIDNGQNPMIAYAGINNFIIPVLALTHVTTWLEPYITTAWRGFWRGALITLLMGLTVSALTKLKVFWRT